MTGERLLCFISGIGIGIAAALVAAPKSRAAVRAALRDSASEGADFVSRQAGEAKKTLTETIQRGKQAAETATDGVAEAVTQGKAVLLG